jgi:hypothetical protein
VIKVTQPIKDSLLNHQGRRSRWQELGLLTDNKFHLAPKENHITEALQLEVLILMKHQEERFQRVDIWREELDLVWLVIQHLVCQLKRQHLLMISTTLKTRGEVNSRNQLSTF